MPHQSAPNRLFCDLISITSEASLLTGKVRTSCGEQAWQCHGFCLQVAAARRASRPLWHLARSSAGHPRTGHRRERLFVFTKLFVKDQQLIAIPRRFVLQRVRVSHLGAPGRF